eukprot:TRINITY_DN10040_c0_g1_i4.p1 TRINITY_DN10040_c0_g1~~TRINITY_DN10040_c0_g1_i4.p1  ORF type:complete len:276 (-),score=19.41 TRINITY_DN10040_c0_g1_i4:593-1420(-)
MPQTLLTGVCGDERSTPPFLPSSTTNSLQPLGTNTNKAPVIIQRRHVPTAMDRHLKYIKTLQKFIKQSNTKQQNEQARESERLQRVRSFTKKLRSDILNGKDVSNTWRPIQEMHTLKRTRDETMRSLQNTNFSFIQREEQDEIDLDQVQQEMEELVDQALANAEEQTPPDRKQQENKQDVLNDFTSKPEENHDLSRELDQSKENNDQVQLDQEHMADDVDDLLSRRTWTTTRFFPISKTQNCAKKFRLYTRKGNQNRSTMILGNNDLLLYQMRPS